MQIKLKTAKPAKNWVKIIYWPLLMACTMPGLFVLSKTINETVL